MADSTRNLDVVIGARDRSKRAFDSANAQLGRMGRNVRRVAVAIASAFFAGGVVQFVKGSLDLFKQQELAERSLADALELVGESSKQAMVDMKAFASTIQKLTVYGDEAVLNIAALGASLGGLTGEALQQATVAAIGLKERLKLPDVMTAMRLVARAAKGDTATLKRYGVMLTEAATATQRYQELLRKGMDAFKLAEGRTETLAGKTEQLANAWSDLREELGARLVPVIGRIVQAAYGNLDNLASGFQKTGVFIVSVVTTMGDGVRAVFSGLGDNLATFTADWGMAMKQMLFAIENWKVSAEVALLTVSSRLVRLGRAIRDRSWIGRQVPTQKGEPTPWLDQMQRGIDKTIEDLRRKLDERAGEAFKPRPLGGPGAAPDFPGAFDLKALLAKTIAVPITETIRASASMRQAPAAASTTLASRFRMGLLERGAPRREEIALLRKQTSVLSKIEAVLERIEQHNDTMVDRLTGEQVILGGALGP